MFSIVSASCYWYDQHLTIVYLGEVFLETKIDWKKIEVPRADVKNAFLRAERDWITCMYATRLGGH